MGHPGGCDGAPASVPSPSQREAIEAARGPLLVLAGPGAGKTFCLTERIRFLIDRAGVAPERICTFTFTNKAAGEIAHRLEAGLGAAAAQVRRGTMHAYCAELLRELGGAVGVDPGFGIADEEYQLNALARIEGPRRWHRKVLTRFSAHRFRGDTLEHRDAVLLQKYERFLALRRLLDFDLLVLRAAALLETPDDGALIRARWDEVLVDEFQDVNPVQYRIIRALAREHQHVFAVGDDEQSIYSWAGADLSVFKSFLNDFRLARRVHLEENRRCPRQVFALARRLMAVNAPTFGDRGSATAARETPFPVRAMHFATDEEEAAWLIGDLMRDRAAHGHAWGDVALLYRKHQVGDVLEGALLNAGIPCRLAQGRSLSEDRVVGYVLAALRVIANPTDPVYRDALFTALLPRSILDEARAHAELNRHDLRRELNHMAASLPRAHETGRHVRRALTNWRNLEALGRQHTALPALVQELLSRRVGWRRSVLDDRRDELTDPAALDDVVALSARLAAVRAGAGTGTGRGLAPAGAVDGKDRGGRDAAGLPGELWIPPLGGVEIALANVLRAVGCRVRAGGVCPPGAEAIDANATPSVGLALGVFKAAQLLAMDGLEAAFENFTAVDIETTDKDTGHAELVEIAAVRVRGGAIVDQFSSLVRPRVEITPGATATHGLTAADVADAPWFEEIWPRVRAFCGDDVIVAHNGYDFDFRILKRMVTALGERFGLCTYDTLPLARDLFPTSRKLEDLARRLGVRLAQAHRALGDTLALAGIVVAMDEVKRARARTTALVNVLDHLGVALALSEEETLGDEATLFRGITRVFALGKYSSCLEAYDRERNGDASLPSVSELIDCLGGVDLMHRIQAEKDATQRYPAAMRRLGRLMADLPDAPLDVQLRTFLERTALSRGGTDREDDGPGGGAAELERSRVNLLTLHSTKGLEFSRVYVVGVEDAQLLGGSPTRGPTPEEVAEARRLLYVGMTRTKDRLVLTHVDTRAGKPTRGHQFLDEMGLTTPESSESPAVPGPPPLVEPPARPVLPAP